MSSSRRATRVSTTRRRGIECRGPIRRCRRRSVGVVRGTNVGVSVGVHRHRRIHRARRQGRGGADRRRASGGSRRNEVHQRVHVRGPRLRDRRTLRVPSHQLHQPVPGQHLHPDTPGQPSHRRDHRRDHTGHSTHTTSSQRHALRSGNHRRDRRNGHRDRPHSDARRSATPPRKGRVACAAGLPTARPDPRHPRSVQLGLPSAFAAGLGAVTFLDISWLPAVGRLSLDRAGAQDEPTARRVPDATGAPEPLRGKRACHLCQAIHCVPLPISVTGQAVSPRWLTGVTPSPVSRCPRRARAVSRRSSPRRELPGNRSWPSPPGLRR
jgi:hypothetical protein